MSKPTLKILQSEDLQNKVCVIIGTRPGIILFSPIIRELKRRQMDYFVIHSGQHYSYNMDRIMFDDLQLEEPAYRLDMVQNCVYHGEQTGEMLKGIEQILLQERPRFVLVGGDANTNLAGALAARKLGLTLGHVEAGERCYDWVVPEEHNRVMIDHISEFLFATGEKAKSYLERESVKGKILVTGNTKVDACDQNRVIAARRPTLQKYSLQPGKYILVTLHREENTDFPQRFQQALTALKRLSRELELPLIMFLHPRTRKRINEFGLEELVAGIRIEEPVGYLDFLSLMSSARLICTDSGGVQQEACILRVPTITLLDNTEWTETLDSGANLLVGVEPERVLQGARKMLTTRTDWPQPFGDGKAAQYIVDVVQTAVQKPGL